VVNVSWVQDGNAHYARVGAHGIVWHMVVEPLPDKYTFGPPYWDWATWRKDSSYSRNGQAASQREAMAAAEQAIRAMEPVE
jgi:hypothetical protein